MLAPGNVQRSLYFLMPNTICASTLAMYTVKYPNEKMSCGERVTLWEMRTKSLVREFFVRGPFRAPHDIWFASNWFGFRTNSFGTRVFCTVQKGPQ